MKNKLLTVLSDVEQFALYGLPDFDDRQRLDYLSLSAAELALASSRPGVHTQVWCALQIGYFKAKHAFFRFTWALRQFSYYGALIGAAPSAAERGRHEVAARELEALLSYAIASYNSGLQGYYFAIALLAWFLGPAWSVAPGR